MSTQNEFGKRLKEFRKRRNLTQKEVATKIGVSEQALSKWENGACLPDVYNLKLLALVLNVSVDCLLDTENETAEKVIETININGAVFEIVEKPATILAGKIIYAKDFSDIAAFDLAIEAVMAESEPFAGGLLKDAVLPIHDIHLSVNFWLSEESRAYTNKSTAQLMAKEQCEIWELFVYIRDYFMPTRGFKMAENGAQELEAFDTFEHKTGYAYMPVMRQ